MKLNILNIRKSINKAFLKVKPNRSQIENFKKNLLNLFEQIDESESEEFHKNIVRTFLRDTYYSPDYYINTKGRTDLVIHNGKDTSTTVGVLVEAKKPTNKSQMPARNNINSTALHELILYYLRERISRKNIEIKHLIITNIYEWYIFNSYDFDRLFAQNKTLVKQYTDFIEGRLAGNRTDFFYKNIAEPFINDIDSDISFTYFDIRDYESVIPDGEKSEDNKLVALFKIFSPEHLLKLPFKNDSNSLDKDFYNELLHIIGLKETKKGAKKLIGRKPKNEMNPGSLLENAITILEYEDCLSQIKASDYGSEKEEQLFNVALELVITWINRILFIKLLEGQLIKYNSGNESFKFVNTNVINDFDELNKLFFQVLAVKETERNDLVKHKFKNIPYLNSSLFEPNDLEHKTIRISNLEDSFKIPVWNSTVLKDKTGKKIKGNLNTLQYLFNFLDAYDFSSEGAEEIQEENKTLINASVLGLIFEKINGYKDGSFFTPGFITMYMCRETIRRAVVQKFNETKNWNCKTINDVYNKDIDIKEANRIINNLKICDPAVGSGHFLVSALNEIISIKNDLKILYDRAGKRLKEYQVEVVNDELVISDEDGELFEYNPKSKESQRIQETLFHEKQTIIENCLFGVDINPNSVKICRLRLWIELLKNAYYINGSDKLETLPNIDINIKCGNSLISRYNLDSNIKKALKKSKWTIDSYRVAVMTYRNAQSKEEKRSMESLIEQIKNDFESEIAATDKRLLKLNKLKGELFALTNQQQLFDQSRTEKASWNKKVKKYTDNIQTLENELEEIRTNKIYENAFEWRFEFPEVLNYEGDFIGFDVIIGNPPYISANEFKKTLGEIEYHFYKNIYETAKGTVDVYIYFFELGYKILKSNYNFCFISPNRYLSANYGIALRKFIIDNFEIVSIGDYSNVKVFAEASTYPIITLLKKRNPSLEYNFTSFTFIDEFKDFKHRYFHSDLLKYLNDSILGFILSEKFEISKKVIDNSIPLNKAGKINATSTAGEAEKFHEYITNNSKGFKLINTGTIDRYITTWGKSELIDKGKKFLKPYLTNEISIIGENRYTLYTNPKIIFAKIALRAEAFYDRNGKYASINTNCMHTFSSEYDAYYILGWLNSKLFQYVFECFFDGLKMAGGYLLYSSPNLNNMFIKKIDNKNQKEIAEKVKSLIKLKGKNDNEYRNYDNEINYLFYKHYSLSDYEIEIVEKSIK